MARVGLVSCRMLSLGLSDGRPFRRGVAVRVESAVGAAKREVFANTLNGIQVTGDAEGPKGERAWLVFALKEVEQEGFDLSDYLLLSAEDAVKGPLDEQYAARRCAIAHAKSHCGKLLPARSHDRRTVIDTVKPLTALVVALLASQGIRVATGGLAPAGMRSSDHCAVIATFEV